RWLENVEAAADQCKKLDMWCFLYDEDNWPSGPVSGIITGPYHPENRAKFLVLFDEDTFESGEHIEYRLTYKEISEETQFFAALAYPNPENYPDFSDVYDKMIDLTNNIKGDLLVWDVPKDDKYEEWIISFYAVVVNSYYSNLNGYIDALRKETVKDFIDHTHKKYVEWFIERGKEDYLGKIVPGIFTDEPSMTHFNHSVGTMLKYITFTPQFPERFKEKYGYDFKEALASLFYDTGKISAKHRCDYFNLATEMYVEAFYKQIYEYCDRYNLRTTGHVNAEGNLLANIYNQGDYFKVFKYMHYGGVDQLTEEVRPDGFENLHNLTELKSNPYRGMANELLIASKLASSAAHFYNKPRVLVEAFGTSSWDITMASAKRVSDYLIATGCDLFVPHDFAYSEDGYRKQDHPASFPHQPYYIHWKKLCDHNARLSSVLNAHNGTLDADVLYLYPTNTIYAESNPKATLYGEIIAKMFNHNADNLMRQQIDFEFANEEIILSGKIEKGKIKINKQEFGIVLLGATTCISERFADFLKEFYNSGGKIIASLLLPFKSPEKGEDEYVSNIMKEIFNIPFEPKEIYANLIKGQGSHLADYKMYESKPDYSKGSYSVFISGPKNDPWKGNYYPLFERACRFAFSNLHKTINVFKDFHKRQHASYVIAIHKFMGANKDNGQEQSEFAGDNASRHFYYLINSSYKIDYKKTIVEINLDKIRELEGLNGDRISGSAESLIEKIELWDTESGDIKLIGADQYLTDGHKLYMALAFPNYRSYLIVIQTRSNLNNVNGAASSDGTQDSQSRSINEKKISNLKCLIDYDNIDEKGDLIKEIDLGNTWDLELSKYEVNKIFNKDKDIISVNCAMLYQDWHSKYYIEAGPAGNYPSLREFTHKFYISSEDDLKEIIKTPVKLVIEGITGDYAWGKTTYQTLFGGDRATFRMLNTEFYINNKRLNVRYNFEPKFLDMGWIVVDITKYLVPGENEVKMITKARNHDTYHLITDPWRIIGNFLVENDYGSNLTKTHPLAQDRKDPKSNSQNEGVVIKKMPTKIQLGDIAKQGLARVHGGIKYSQEIIIPSTFKDRKIFLEIQNTEDTIDVFINDKYCATLWYEWRLFLNDKIDFDQLNKITLVYYGIAQNMLQTNLKPQGLMDPIKIKIYK
ncbi:MAG: hypothetical protein ACTSXF_08355, partial [Promethearchaeota archaeon]